MSEQCYVALKDCGCLVMATMEHCRDAGREVGRAIRDGYAVERVDPERVRDGTIPMRCDVCHPPKASQQTAPIQQESFA